MSVPGWEGSIGPSPAQYGDPHVYARDVASGAGNCVCGRDPGHRLHVPIGCRRCAELEARLADYERTRTLGGPVTDRRVPTLPGAWTNT